MDNLRIYGMLVAASLKGQWVHKASFLLWTLGQALTVGTELAALWLLFVRFGPLPGWTLSQVGLLCGIVHVAFAVAECAGRGFDRFSDQLRSGEFDRVLLRPVPTAWMVAGQHLELSRLGRLVSGIATLAWALPQSGVAVDFSNMVYLAATVLSGVALFLGIFILQATACFWTIESLEVVNILTYGGVASAEMPLTVYPNPLRLLFTWIVPIACMNYLPADRLLGRSDHPWTWATPLAGFVFFAVCLLAWRRGVQEYVSTGS